MQRTQGCPPGGTWELWARAMPSLILISLLVAAEKRNLHHTALLSTGITDDTVPLPYSQLIQILKNQGL